MASSALYLLFLFLLLLCCCFSFAFGGSSRPWPAVGTKKCGEGQDPLIMSISQIDLGFSHPQTAVTLSLTCTPASHPPPPFFLHCGPGWSQDLVDPSVLLLLGKGNCLLFAGTSKPMASKTELGPNFTFLYSHSPPLDLTLAPHLALFHQD